MQRFYMFHSFSKFHRNSIAAASLFLAAKVNCDLQLQLLTDNQLEMLSVTNILTILG